MTRITTSEKQFKSVYLTLKVEKINYGSLKGKTFELATFKVLKGKD